MRWYATENDVLKQRQRTFISILQLENKTINTAIFIFISVGVRNVRKFTDLYGTRPKKLFINFFQSVLVLDELVKTILTRRG